MGPSFFHFSLEFPTISSNQSEGPVFAFFFGKVRTWRNLKESRHCCLTIGLRSTSYLTVNQFSSSLYGSFIPPIAGCTMCESGWSSINGKVSMKVSAVKEELFYEFYSARRRFIWTPTVLHPKYIDELPHSSGKSRSFWGSGFNCQKAFCPVSLRSGQQLEMVLSLLSQL